MKAPALIRRYLKRAGWAQRRLAELCQVHPTGIHHVLSGRRPISMDQAMRLERGTRAALASGLTDVAPLLARDLLLPKDVGLLPPA